MKVEHFKRTFSCHPVTSPPGSGRKICAPWVPGIVHKHLSAGHTAGDCSRAGAITGQTKSMFVRFFLRGDAVQVLTDVVHNRRDASPQSSIDSTGSNPGLGENKSRIWTCSLASAGLVGCAPSKIALRHAPSCWKGRRGGCFQTVAQVLWGTKFPYPLLASLPISPLNLHLTPFYLFMNLMFISISPLHGQESRAMFWKPRSIEPWTLKSRDSLRVY